MNVGILGLGLIGGSLARVYTKAGHSVYAFDTDKSIEEFAMLSNVITATLDRQTIQKCDLILLAVYTSHCIDWLEEHSACISRDAYVIDCCGIKQDICRCGFRLADQYGYTFVGGHPMAGSHFSGFKYSRSNLFQGAPMVLVPPRFDDPALLSEVKEKLSPCGFGSFSVTTAQAHDKMIAFTSQMPHILSNAFIKSPTAKAHNGFSAGSYKDMTRVAWLNPQMWAELFLSNKDNVLSELDIFIDHLQQYRKALLDEDSQKLIRLLEEGKKCKEEVDG